MPQTDYSLTIPDWIRKLFDTSDFPARWNCGNWSEAFGWSYIAADLMIAAAYFAIPASIAIYFLRRRRELYFPVLYWLFAAFISFCGLGHLVDATLFWKPWYRLACAIHWMTALVSWATLIALIYYLPDAVRLPGALRLSREREAQIVALERAQAALQEREAQFRTLAETVPLVIFTADGTGQVDFINSTYTEITGRSATEAEGGGWMDAIVSAERPTVAEAWSRAQQSKSPFVAECHWTTARGDARWFLVRAVRTGKNSDRWIGFAADITAQKEDADRQVQLERALQESQKLESLGVLAGGIAHDFNNLLTGVLGNVSMAQQALMPHHGAVEHLHQIEQITLRAADLCRQMLAYSGKGRFVVARINMSRLIEETTSLIHASISKKAVIRFNLEPGLPACEGDPTQLRQVIMNLVINASDAIGDRSGFITIHTGSVRADRAYLQRTYGTPGLEPGDYIFVEITDTGCGMSQETISRIFDPFFTTKFTGRGLGLAAVLGIIKGHKGAIRVYSEVGKGTTFRMLIPACDGPADATTDQKAATEPWKAEGTILVVDDEETLRSVVCRLLESWGFRCVTAAHGREALELLQAQSTRIDAILMDLTMPHMDGEQAFREIRKVLPEIPVVLMSGFNEHEAISRFVGKGLTGFIQKPFHPAQLEAVLRKAFQDRRP